MLRFLKLHPNTTFYDQKNYSEIQTCTTSLLLKKKLKKSWKDRKGSILQHSIVKKDTYLKTFTCFLQPLMQMSYIG